MKRTFYSVCAAVVAMILRRDLSEIAAPREFMDMERSHMMGRQ